MKRVSAASSSVSSPTRRRDVESSGLKYLVASPASPPLPRNCAAKPLTTSCRSPRVRRGRRGGCERGAVLEPLGALGCGGERDVAVGDARQRRQADRRVGARAQRRVGLLHADLDRRQVVGRQLDALDRADAPAADLHVVVGHELAGVLEQQRVLGAAAAAEQQQPRREQDDEREREHGGAAGDRHR
jgi:hypothetical protein